MHELHPPQEGVSHLLAKIDSVNSIDLSTELMKLPEVDEEEVDNMILTKKERGLKIRIWNNLNKEWLTEQNERKRKKKEQAKKIKS